MTPEERILALIFGKRTFLDRIAGRLSDDWTDDELGLPKAEARRAIPRFKRWRLLAAWPLYTLDERIRVRRYVRKNPTNRKVQ